MGKKGEGNRHRIIKEADNLFYRRGYNQTSFQDISDATDIPRGNFYYYFKTKEEILEAVINSRVDDLSEMLVKVDAENSEPRERLLMFSDLLKNTCDDVMESGCPLGTLCSELVKDAPVLHKKSSEVFSVLRNWIKIQLEELNVANSDDLAMEFLSKMQGATVMGSAFNDSDFIYRSHKQLRAWVSEITKN